MASHLAPKCLINSAETKPLPYSETSNGIHESTTNLPSFIVGVDQHVNCWLQSSAFFTTSTSQNWLRQLAITQNDLHPASCILCILEARSWSHQTIRYLNPPGEMGGFTRVFVVLNKFVAKRLRIWMVILFHIIFAMMLKAPLPRKKLKTLDKLRPSFYDWKKPSPPFAKTRNTNLQGISYLVSNSLHLRHEGSVDYTCI